MQQVSDFTTAKKVLTAYVPPAGSLPEVYKLDRMRSLMDYLGNPQDSYQVVHVAGTSGKTSTCYYVAAILAASGAKVGLTVSPHITEVNERVQLNLTPLPEAVFCRELSEFLTLLGAAPVRPTYFELLVAFAYWEFARMDVDFAVVEVGLGGLLDGTNVVHRRDKVCVLTDIGLDHTAILGKDLPSIAAQKAGILLPGNRVFAHRQAPEVMDVFMQTAARQGAELTVVADGEAAAPAELPVFQRRNWSLALAASLQALQQAGVAEPSAAALRQAAAVTVPARMELFQYQDKIIVLDGSHNQQKLHALATAVAARFPGQKTAVLLGLLEAKREQLELALRELEPLTDHLITTACPASQDLRHVPLPPEEIMAAWRAATGREGQVTQEPVVGLELLLRRPEEVLLVTGSLYLASELRPKLQELA